MKKILLSALLILSLTVSLAAFTSCGDSSSDGSQNRDDQTLTTSRGLEYIDEGEAACYVSGIGECTDTVIVIGEKSPSDKTIIGIDEDAFHNNTTITSVTTSDRLKSIDEDAFSGCTSLVSVTIGNRVDYIGDDAFAGCTSLSVINFNGTEQEWNRIQKGDDWDLGTGNYTLNFLVK